MAIGVAVDGVEPKIAQRLLKGCKEAAEASSSRLRIRDILGGKATLRPYRLFRSTAALANIAADATDSEILGTIILLGFFVGGLIIVILAMVAKKHRDAWRRTAMVADVDVDVVADAHEFLEDNLSPDHLARHEAGYLGGEGCGQC